MDKKSSQENEETIGIPYNPTSLYNDTLQQILHGLYKGIVLHHGKLEQVNREDILAGSTLSPAMLDQYFKGTDKIMSEVYNELLFIIAQIEKNMGRYIKDAVIIFLLENLSKQPMMLNILIALDDYHFWERSLRNVMCYLTTEPWWEVDEDTWEELYMMFCYEFQSILKWWSSLDFKYSEQKAVFIRIKSWLAADAAYAKFLNFDWVKEEW